MFGIIILQEKFDLIIIVGLIMILIGYGMIDNIIQIERMQKNIEEHKQIATDTLQKIKDLGEKS